MIDFILTRWPLFIIIIPSLYVIAAMFVGMLLRLNTALEETHDSPYDYEREGI